MKRSHLSFLLALVSVTHSTLAWAYHQEVKALSGRMAESLAKSGKKTVAVVDFTDLQGNVTELGRFLAEHLSVSLAGEGKDLEVIDRTHLKAILQEHKLSATGLIDPQTARKLGQIAGVEALVTGSITPFGDSVNLSVKALDTLTARMIGASTADIPKTKAVEELLARGIGGPNETAGSRVASTPGVSGSSTASAKKPADPTEVQRGDFKFGIRRCRKSGGTISCTGYVVNAGPQRKEFRFSRGSFWIEDGIAAAASMVDSVGNQSPEIRFSFGAGDSEQDLEPDVPVNFTVSGGQMSPDATSVTLVLTYRGADDTEWQKVSLRHIPLQ